MNGGEALRNKRNGSVFILIEIQSANEPAGLVGGLDLDLHITLHISPCCEFGSFITIGFVFFGCVA